MKGSIYHFHAKDTFVDPLNASVNGVLDTGSMARLEDRSWYFRTVGYGNDAKFWKDVVSSLRLADYDRSVSIEHEDALMSGREGLEKAVAFLKGIIIQEQPGAAYWA